MRLSSRVLLLAVLAAAAPSALAAPRSVEAEVEHLSNEAVAAYRSGDFARSISLLEQAYHLHADPVLLYNLAKAEEMSGNRERARARYRAFLAAPTGDSRLKIKARTALKRLDEPATPPPVAATPSPERTASQPPPPPPPTATPTPTPTAASAAAPVAEAPPRPRARAKLQLAPRQEWIAGAVIAAVGVATIGGGAALYADVVSLHDQFANVADGPSGTNEDAKRDLLNRASARSAASTALYAIGGLFVAGGGALVTHGLLRARHEPQHAMLTPFFSGQEVGLCVRQSF